MPTPTRASRWLACASVIALALGAAACDNDNPDRSPSPSVASPSGEDRTFATNDPIERACALPEDELVRIWRGLYPGRSVDLSMVAQPPNYIGTFELNSHTGPWDYLQEVPLVFYGPSHIKALGEQEGLENVTSVYPTVGALTDVDLDERDGRVLSDILKPTETPPKLILTIAWDGVGRNVLERWPDRWPNLKRMVTEGVSFVDATVGSSPTQTPTVHATLGTGTFPRAHGITSINQRVGPGPVEEVFLERDMSELEESTYGDEIDLALDNAPRVGLLAWVSWHLAMMSHGTSFAGGDADEVVMVDKSGAATSQATGSFSTPSYAYEFEGMEDRADELDRSDGEVDGKWLGQDILAKPTNPAWMTHQGDLLLEMLERGEYGADAVPDLLFTNFKSTDLVGHHYTMDSREMAETLEAQDEALGRALDYLDEEVGDYVVILTSDHGHTPSYEKTGAFAISNDELKADLAREFDVPSDVELVVTSPSGMHFNWDQMKRYGVSGEEIAAFLNAYTIEQNWAGDELPPGFEERGDEHVFSATFLSTQMSAIMRCAFGSTRPPSGFDA